MRLIVLRRCVLESSLDPDECEARLRQATYRFQPWFWARRPFVGRVSAKGFSVRGSRRRALPARASGSVMGEVGMGAQISLELGIGLPELIPSCLITVFFGLGLLQTSLDPGGLLNAGLAVVWLAMFAYPLLRWNRRADELVARLSAACEAEPAPLIVRLG